MTRYRAFVIHFIASFLVVSAIFIFVKLVWYPGELFFAASGNNILFILLLVDLTLGPLLTLIVFDQSKASLKYDLGFIVFVQFLFMVYGLWVVFSARPAFIVYNNSSFHLVTANKVEHTTPENIDLPFKTPLWGPQFVAVSLSESDMNAEKAQYASFAGVGPQYFPEFYVPFESVRNNVLLSAKTLQQLTSLSPPQKAFLSQYENSFDARNKRHLYVPLITEKSTFFVSLAPETGKINDVIELNN